MGKASKLCGAFCCYCKRTLTASTDRSGTAATFDHLVPVRDGGRRVVPCCRTCNQLKGDLDPESWWWFVRATPRYWKSFSTHAQVRDVVRRERVRRVMLLAGQPAGDGPAA